MVESHSKSINLMEKLLEHLLLHSYPTRKRDILSKSKKIGT